METAQRAIPTRPKPSPGDGNYYYGMEPAVSRRSSPPSSGARPSQQPGMEPGRRQGSTGCTGAESAARVVSLRPREVGLASYEPREGGRRR